jgi:hypothetical protein
MIRILTFIFLATFAVPAVGQHPLEGTWEMVSLSGINVDGEKFYLDSTTVKETKIITSSHYILIAMDKVGDEWIFNRCYAGAVRMQGQTYYEIPAISSLRIFENVKTDFRWRIEGDRFIQSGTITRPDGKQIILHEFVFARSRQPNGASGTIKGYWELKQPDSHRGLFIANGTHWMMITRTDDKLMHASGGTIVEHQSKPHALVAYSFGPNSHLLPLQVDKTKLRVDGLLFEQ